MKKKFLILSCCVLALLVTACGKNTPKLKNGEEVVASIDGKKYTADELYKELKGTAGYDKLLSMIDNYIASKEIEDSKDIENYAKEVVEYYKSYASTYGVELEEFLVSYVGISGVTTEEEFLDYVINDYKLSLAIQKQIGSTYTDKEIENYYKENYSELLTVRHILIEIEESDKDGSKALSTINKLIDELKKAEDVEEKFIELAKEYSDDSSYSTGGLISDFMSSKVVKEFWDASYSLKDGEYTTKAVKTDYGYHIIYRKSVADKPKLEDSKEDIKSALAEEAMAEDELLVYVAMADLRKKYNIKFYDTDLKNSYNNYLKQIKTEN